MLDELITEQRNPKSEGIDARSAEEILRIINAEDQTVPAAVAAEIPQIARAVDGIVERLSAGGHLFYIGAGTSGRLGVLDAAECPPTFRVSSELVQGIIAGGDAALVRATEASEDDAAMGASDLVKRGFRGGDVLVGIATSGMGALTIGISSNPDSELARRADIAITPVTGPEVITGSTRLKAGTATKLVLNMMSTAAMIRLGHVFGNLMVNVRPVNSKLAERARGIISLAAGVTREEAARLLDETGGDVKVAILMARFRVSKTEAVGLLEAAHGRLSEAIGEWTSL